MNRRIAFPFLTLSNSTVSATAWEISLDGRDWTEADDHVADWDASTTIRMRRTISVGPELAVRDLGIPENQLQLAVAIRIGTGQGRLPRATLMRHRHTLDLASPSWEVEFPLAGRNLSTVLDLLTEIYLAASPVSPSSLAPRSAGDRLWADRVRLRLEGAEPRFPIEAADFATLLGETVAASAPWYLHWSPRDWDRDFHGAVRIYLNERATGVFERVENQDRPTLQALLAEVMGQICERLVLDPEAADLMERAEPWSLGAQAATWLRMAWPGRDVPFIRSVLENRPGVFRSTFLALADPGEE